ncbi:hypothetical protein NFI96_000765, partial [Prochilodus magdalenae]
MKALKLWTGPPAHLGHHASLHPPTSHCTTDCPGVGGYFSPVQELRVDIDYTGDDIQQIYSPDASHCQLACTEHNYCLYFAFLRSDWTTDS